MRRLLFILFLFTIQTVGAQPDIKKNIFIAEKHCKPIYWLNSSTYSIDYMPNVDLFAASYNSNKLSANSGTDIALYRIDANTYDTVWCKYYGGSLDDQATDIHLKSLPNGHILIAGTTQSYDMDFISNPYQGGRAVYFMELDTLGNLLRIKMLNSNSGPIRTTIRDVAVDNLGNIYATGSTWNDNMDFAHVANGKDAWILKLDSTLSREWMRFWVGYGSDQAFGLGLIHNGNIAVTGGTGDTGTVEMLSQFDKGKGDLFIEAYNPQGITLWKGRFGGTELEYGREVCFNPLNNDIYVLGPTKSATGDIGYHTANASSMDTNSLENENVWVLKLDTMGSLIQSKAYGYKRSPNHPDISSYYRDTKYRDAIIHNGNLWVCALQDGLGGGDTDSCDIDKGSNLWFGCFDDKANLVAKYTINEYDGEELERGNMMVMNNTLYAFGRSLTGGAVTNSFSCDSNIYDIQFIVSLNKAPLSVADFYQPEEANFFKLFPNPGYDNITIELERFLAHEEYAIRVTNSEGKKLLKKEMRTGRTSIDCSQWSEGLYYIRLSNKTNKQTKIFIKH